MNRGDFVTVVIQGDFGKPRPALIIQSDQFSRHGTVTVLPITSTLINAPLIRVTIEPSKTNGLQKHSQVMIDKAATIKRSKVSAAFGSANGAAMLEVSRCLAVFLGIAK